MADTELLHEMWSEFQVASQRPQMPWKPPQTLPEHQTAIDTVKVLEDLFRSTLGKLKPESTSSGSSSQTSAPTPPPKKESATPADDCPCEDIIKKVHETLTAQLSSIQEIERTVAGMFLLLTAQEAQGGGGGGGGGSGSGEGSGEPSVAKKGTLGASFKGTERTAPRHPGLKDRRFGKHDLDLEDVKGGSSFDRWRERILGGLEEAGKVAGMNNGMSRAGEGLNKLGDQLLKSNSSLAKWGGMLTKSVGAVSSAYGQIVDIGDKMKKHNFQFAQFSGEMAFVQATSRMREIELEKYKGGELAGSADQQARAHDSLMRAIAPFETKMSRVMNHTVGWLQTSARLAYKYTIGLLPGMDGEEEISPANSPIHNFTRDIADVQGREYKNWVETHGKPKRFVQ